MSASSPREVGPMHYPPPVAELVARPIADHAQVYGADLVVMATHGRGGLRSTSLGSVADELIRSVSCPVFLTRPIEEPLGQTTVAAPGLNHIVIAVDGSETAEQMIRFALDLGSPFAARYSLLLVVLPVDFASEAAATGPSEYLQQLADSMKPRSPRHPFAPVTPERQWRVIGGAAPARQA